MPITAALVTVEALPTEVTSPVRFALVVTVAALPLIEPAIVEENVWVPVNVCPASVRAIVADVVGKVRVVLSVPEKVSVLFTVSVLPSKMVRVDPVAGVVRTTLLRLVALAAPKVGETKVGEVENTKLVEVVPVVPVAEAK